MTQETKTAVRKVLRTASRMPCFFDLSDAERLCHFIAMGFELGRKKVPRGIPVSRIARARGDSARR